jgi:hypothetical protein
MEAMRNQAMDRTGVAGNERGETVSVGNLGGKATKHARRKSEMPAVTVDDRLEQLPVHEGAVEKIRVPAQLVQPPHPERTAQGCTASAKKKRGAMMVRLFPELIWQVP